MGAIVYGRGQGRLDNAPVQNLAWLHAALRGQRLAPWLLMAAAGHAWLLAPAVESPWRPVSAPSASAVTLQWRAVVAPAPQAVAVPSPGAATPHAAAAPTPSAPAPRPRETATPSQPVASPSSEAAPALTLPTNGRWSYRLLWQGQEGDAWLDWSRSESHYRLALERRTPERLLPQWLSEGRWTAQGLVSERFAAQRGPRSWRRIHDDASAEEAQDRLSWMLQLPALLQSRPQSRSIVLRVRDWRGQAQDWVFERLSDDTIDLPGGQQRAAQHWRRLPQGEAQVEIALWLDPADGHRVLRTVHRLQGEERWELLWNPAGADGKSPEGVINPP
jgi:hypothetical protein